MDKIFEDFKRWIVSKNGEWKIQNVIIEEIIESTHANQIHVNLQSRDGFGHIGIFESNNLYWIEFEGVAGEFENFYKYDEFNELPDLRDFENEYIRFLTNT
ncbi:hypothetical protein [Oceanirhabdus sp. W0125-5]|uniref:hypothetical protein n=1 Tax=Oceanirhabdus sp. W0125-5 TaxID=2999116 RepID=UPI0022F2FDBC|nr:hypothetical protein [Oceanirhabdus sp. W0125-5]WBW99482.1 hypothetical protein OW730_12260 [Oceanirhabdus sp. W0125-5]